MLQKPFKKANILPPLHLPFGSERSVRTESLTCEEVPEIVGFNGLLVATTTCLPVLDLVSSDDAVLGAARRRLPQHLDALQDEKRDFQLRHTHTHMTAAGKFWRTSCSTRL